MSKKSYKRMQNRYFRHCCLAVGYVRSDTQTGRVCKVSFIKGGVKRWLKYCLDHYAVNAEKNYGV